ncbi:AAA family ATPase [Streptomyces sp. NPDC088357]|uniref:helix-turn-helix transcriptional regulator n=1 Tax=Streptomyces sp. NPDC088357 TaxID=3154655 RepID=UPI0034132CED
MKFVECESQLSQLTGLLESCRRGEGAVAVVTSPIAAGKSRLLHALAQEALKTGAVVVSATGSYAESSLPLGLLGQLLHNAPMQGEILPPAFGEQGHVALSAALEAGGWQSAQAMETLREALLRVAGDHPMVIEVDDAEYIDPLSLKCLLYCVRRIRSTPVLVVLTGTESPRLDRSLELRELLGLPHCHRIRLPLLSERGVARGLRDELGPVDAERFAHIWHNLTGGNPLLLRALAEDQRIHSTVEREQGETVIGPTFRQAVLSCLERCAPETRAVLHGIAIFNEAAPTALVASLVGMDPVTAGLHIHALNEAGLLAGGRFRHPHVRTAVLSDVEPERRARLHLDAGQLLHDAGAAAVTVAGHFVASERTPPAWSLQVLREAARSTLVHDQVEVAVRCLELAHKVATEPADRAVLQVAAAMAEWRVDPSRSMSRLPAIAAALRAGTLRDQHAVLALRALLWHGRVEEVVDLLHRTDGIDDVGTRETVGRWLAACFPPARESSEKVAGTPGPGPSVLVTGGPDTTAATALTTVLGGGNTDDGVSRAEQVLESARLDDVTLEPITLALLTLVYADRLDVASRWCERLFQTAREREATCWTAMLGAVRAEIAMRRGDPGSAEVLASSALRRMSPTAWGVAVGLCLSVRVQALSVMGRYTEAEAVLNEPTPDALLKSRYGLGYLYSRGRLHFTMKRFRAALDDFLACGDLMQAWEMDLPGFIPWRADAAAACLRVGKPGPARQLVMDQMQRPGAHQPRPKGGALRVLAAAGDLKSRPMMLRESIDHLQQSGDRVEMAHALADLAHAQHELGQLDHARMTSKLAAQVARECRARPLLDSLIGKVTDPARDNETAKESEGFTELSEAEWRVANLAARGDTNREIARRLFITVSTVEQHLTRVYRKLEVGGRGDLPAKFNQITAGVGSP